MRIYSVSELVSAISDYLEMGLGTVAVQGEVSGCNISQGRLVFFELKDDNSRISCFALTHQLTSELKNGMEIKLLGLPKLFKKSGKFHLHVQEVELVGAGALQKAFDKLKARLDLEGLFADKHKQALPRFPEAVGLITSREAAAYNDVMVRLNERWGGLKIFFAQTGVQGLGAVGQIVRAIEYFNTREQVDVLILTRGGGSLEDLQAFNDERLVRAVFGSRTPIVVGVGHERDVTLAELAADVRASTPTNAAVITVPDQKETADNISLLANNLVDVIDQQVSLQKNYVKDLVYRLDTVMQGVVYKFNLLWQNFHQALLLFKQQVAHQLGQVARQQSQLLNNVSAGLTNWQQKLDNIKVLMRTMNPESTLRRGYSLTYFQGRILKSVKHLKNSSEIKTRLSDGEFVSIIKI